MFLNVGVCLLQQKARQWPIGCNSRELLVASLPERDTSLSLLPLLKMAKK
jgi:hypothetical protein